jgi:hypothetical protein
MKRILPVFLLFAFLLNGCGGAKTPAQNVAPVEIATLVPLGTPVAKYGVDVARPLIRDITNIGPREAGSPAEAQAAQYIESVFKALGYSLEIQPFTADSGNKPITSANVVAVKKGTSAQEIIVGAHYDSSGAGPGADENASGVAAMLEVAKHIAGQTTPYTIRFIAFGAGDSGLLGSYAYVNQMTQSQFENIIAMIDLNSLVAGNIAYVFSDETQPSIRNWALSWATGNGLDLQTVKDANLTNPANSKGVSDFAAFRDAGIPYAYFSSADWTLGNKKGQTQVDTSLGENGVIRQTKYDSLAYLDATFPGRVDQHLNLFISIIYNFLTQYEAPIK